MSVATGQESGYFLIGQVTDPARRFFQLLHRVQGIDRKKTPVHRFGVHVLDAGQLAVDRSVLELRAPQVLEAFHVIRGDARDLPALKGFKQGLDRRAVPDPGVMGLVRPGIFQVIRA